MSETAVVDELEILQSSVKEYSEDINGEIFIQKPLSFFGKIELFSVLANAIEKALSEGAFVSELLGDGLDLANTNLGEADVLVKGIAKIMKYAPETLQEIFAISFRIKRNEKEWFFEVIEDIDDEQAMRILNQFIDQNWDAIMDFSKEQVMPLIQNVSGKLQPSESTPSKPSRASRARTKKE